jgi:hypothetical protein
MLVEGWPGRQWARGGKISVGVSKGGMAVAEKPPLMSFPAPAGITRHRGVI